MYIYSHKELYGFKTSHPDHRKREKICMNLYFHSSLWSLKRFCKGLKDLYKTFWGTTKKRDNKYLSWYKILIQLSEMQDGLITFSLLLFRSYLLRRLLLFHYFPVYHVGRHHMITNDVFICWRLQFFFWVKIASFFCFLKISRKCN